MNNWYKDGFFWLDPDSSDAGDVIYNTMSRIIDMEDKSDWANDSLNYCIWLLNDHKRWPNHLNQENTAKNFIQWWFSKKYTRPQHFLTRDPYYAVICCALHLGKVDKLKLIRIPWYCFSPSIWMWRRKLIKPRKKSWWKWRLNHYKYLALAIKTGDDPNIIANKEEANLN